jgi:hypothetical protein
MPNSFLVLIAALVLCACQTRGEALVEPLATVDPAQGCVGSPVKECLSLLADVIRIEEYNRAIRRLEHGIEVDINGRPTAPEGELTLGPIPKPNEQTQIIIITYTPNGIVRKFEMSLKSNAYLSKTYEEYHATGLYETMRYALGACADTLDPTTAYQFFENKIKPAAGPTKLYSESNRVETDKYYFRSAGPISVCGRTVTATNTAGVSKDAFIKNSKSYHNGMYLSFE